MKELIFFVAIVMLNSCVSKDYSEIKNSNSKKVGSFHNLPPSVQERIIDYYKTKDDSTEVNNVVNLTDKRINFELHVFPHSAEAAKFGSAFLKLRINNDEYRMTTPYWPVIIENGYVYFISLDEYERTHPTLDDYNDYTYFKFKI